MTAPTDPRAEARALIRHWLDNGVPSRTEFRELLQSLDAALEAALEREGRKDAVVEAVRGVIDNKCLHGTPGMYGCESANRLKSAWTALVDPAARREDPKP